LAAQPYAMLQSDAWGTTSGSEVITVQQFNQGGPYQASVFNYSDQSYTGNSLSNYGVSLSVINGGTVVFGTNGAATVQGGSLVSTLTPTPNLVGNTWQAISIDPATGQVTMVNQITNTTDGITPATPGTYTFRQTGNSAWTSIPTTTNTTHMTSTGWGVRTWTDNVLPQTYYTSTSEGDRTVLQGAPFVPGRTSTGASVATLNATVTGVLGSTLTGTGTMTGTGSFGETISYTGSVVIDAEGRMTFTYANGVNSSAARLISASGTNTYTPGDYFTQDLYGIMVNSAGPATTPPYGVQSTISLGAGATTTGDWSWSLAQYYLNFAIGSAIELS